MTDPRRENEEPDVRADELIAKAPQMKGEEWAILALPVLMELRSEVSSLQADLAAQEQFAKLQMERRREAERQREELLKAAKIARSHIVLTKDAQGYFVEHLIRHDLRKHMAEVDEALAPYEVEKP